MKKRGRDKEKIELMRMYIEASGCFKTAESAISHQKNSIKADIRLSESEREQLLNKFDIINAKAAEAIFEYGYKKSSYGLLNAMAKINYKSKMYKFMENMTNVSNEISGWVATEMAIEIKKMGLGVSEERENKEFVHDELIKQYIENYTMELIDSFTSWAFDRLKVCFSDVDEDEFIKEKERIVTELSRFYRNEFTEDELITELEYYTSSAFKKSQGLSMRAAKIVQKSVIKYIESFGITKEELIKKTKDHKFG